MTCIQGPLCALLFLLCWTAEAGEREKYSFPKETISTPLLAREKRQLLFPNTTLLQLLIGVTVPTPAKNINCNWAFQTNFQLPWNRTQIPTDIFLANSGYDGDSRVIRAKRQTKDDKDHPQYSVEGQKRREILVPDLYGVYNSESRLLHLYQSVEKMLESFGYEGSPCVLRALCQLAKEPLHADHKEDLLHELASFVIDPNNELYENNGNEENMHPYLAAFASGRAFQDCTALYGGCSLDIVDIFTSLRVH